jgi:hypothetical protein
VVHLADLLEEAAHQLEEAEDPATAPVVAVAEVATVGAVPEEEHTAQTEAVAAEGVVDAAEDHPSAVAHRRDNTGRVQVETSCGNKETALAAAAVLEAVDGRTEQVQMGPGPEQERAKEVVRTG